MNAVLAFGAFLATLFIYIAVARKARRPASLQPDDFFLSRSQHQEAEFGASQVAYQLQMSTIYPFFVFAATGDWWLAIWNTGFYLIGIILLYVLLPRFSRKSISLVGSSSTLHALIGSIHESPQIRRFTAWLSVVGFAGLAAFEIVWGAKALSVLLGGSSSIYYLATSIMGFYLVLYLWAGGQYAAIRADQIQLLLGYIGLHILVAWSVWHLPVPIRALDAPFLVIVILAGSLMIVYYRIRAFRTTKGAFLRALDSITILSFVIMIVSVTFQPTLWQAAVISMKPIHGSLIPDFNLKLLAFASLPIAFQFVDMSNWQRMVAIAKGSSPGEISTLSAVRSGLLQYLRESPLSWVLPVVMGMCAMHFLKIDENTDPWDAFVTYVLAQSGFLGALLSTCLLCGVGAIFLSTADSLLSCLGYTFAYDINRRTTRLMDSVASESSNLTDIESQSVIRVGRVAMSFFLGGVLIMFIVADIAAKHGTSLLGLFLSFYGPMVAFAPAILIPALSGRRAPLVMCWLSIAAGAVAGIAVGCASVWLGGKWQWIAMIVPSVVAWPIYVVGWLWNVAFQRGHVEGA